MLELYQAEWCPHSHRVRERLTELGVDFVVRQVAPQRLDRERMREATGADSIPLLVTDEGETIADADPILEYLDRRFEEPSNAAGHRAQEEAHPPLRQGASRAA